MGSKSNGLAASERLTKLTQQLRLHKSSIQYNSLECSKSSESEANKLVKSNEKIKSKRAAVLICVFEGENGEFRVILTKRSSKLSLIAGDVSLPGGKTEEGYANEVETALREAKEEIGLDPSLVHVVTVLEPFVTKVGMTVVLVLGILSDRSFTLTRIR